MDETTSLPKLIRFCVFEMDRRAGELRKQGLKIRLQEKPFQVLELLLEHPGEAVTRDELRKRLWPADTFVDFDHGLNSAINRLREALGDSAENPRFVETLARRGYRFIAPVEPVVAGAPPIVGTDQRVRPIQGAHLGAPLRKRTRLAVGIGVGSVAVVGAVLVALNIVGLRDRLLTSVGARRAVPLQIESIAVLPLENLSRDPDQEYFADGMTEALITALGKISTLRVISRTSVMQYKGTRKPLPEIARELNVDAVVEGTVLHSGNRVRISTNLLHAPTDRHLWAESYERDARDVLALQGEVAKAIADQVQIKLTPQVTARLASARPVNPEAHEAYLKGRYFWNKRTEEPLKKSIGYFEQAIKKEPEYALAYVGLADSYSILAQWDLLPPHEAYPKAKAAAVKALEIDERLGEAHTSMAAVKAYYDWDFAGGEKEYKRAIELNPNYATAHQWYSELLSDMGRHEEAIAEVRKAQGLDPLSLIINSTAGEAFRFARRYDQALEHYRKALEIDPNFAGVHEYLGRAYVEMGEYEKAISELQKALSLSGGSPGITAELAHAYAVAGKKREALKILDELDATSKRRYVSPFLRAHIYTGLGDSDRAFYWLERAYEDRSNLMTRLKVDPRFDPLRSDPPFQNLLRRIGLPS